MGVRAFADHWHVMVRTGYDTQYFREAIDLFGDVLQVSRSKMSPEQIADVVTVLKSIERSVGGYCLSERAREDPAVWYSTGDGLKDPNPWPPIDHPLYVNYESKRYAGE